MTKLYGDIDGKLNVRFDPATKEWEFICFGVECSARHAPLPTNPHTVYASDIMLPDPFAGGKYNGYLNISNSYSKEEVENAFSENKQSITMEHKNLDGTTTYGFDTLHTWNNVEDGLLENIVTKCCDILSSLKGWDEKK